MAAGQSPKKCRPQTATAAQRVAFHSLVTDTRYPVLLLNPGNRKAGTEVWTAKQAVESGLPRCVVVKADYAAIDFDDPPEGAVPNGITRAILCAKAFEAAGYKPCVFKSGGNGRAHLWMRFNEDKPDLVTNLAKLHKGQHRSGPWGRMRPPMSPHRTGVEMTLVYPRTIGLALKRLGWKRPVKSADAFRTSDQKYQQLLNDCGHDRSAHMLRVASYCKLNRYSREAYVNDVLEHPQGIGHKLNYTEQGSPCVRHDAVAYAERTYDRAAVMLPRGDRAALHVQFALLREAAMKFEWPNKRQKVLLSFLRILDIAETRAQSLTLSLSCRDLAEGPLIAASTAARHIEVLRDLNFITQTKPFFNTHSAEYRITFQPENLQDATRISRPLPNRRSVSYDVGKSKLISEALARKPGLKQLCLHILAMPKRFTTGELRNASNTRYESCRKGLQTLKSLGIAQELKKGTWTADLSDETLRNVAEMRGTAELEKQLVARHSKEKAAHIEWRNNPNR